MRQHYVLRVFTRDGEGGNHLGVVTDVSTLTDGDMQAIAAQLGFSETVFLDSTIGSLPHARIFTPTREMPFAGHPLVGAAWVLKGLGSDGPDALVCQVGEIGISFDGEAAWIDAPLGQRVSAIDDFDATRFGLPAPSSVAAVEMPLRYVLVELDGPAAVSSYHPDRAALAGHPDGGHTLIWAHAGPGRVRTRFFAPASGVFEDPATGSAAVALAASPPGGGEPSRKPAGGTRRGGRIPLTHPSIVDRPRCPNRWNGRQRRNERSRCLKEPQPGPTMAAEGSRATVVVAFVGNGVIAVAKLVVAGITGSAAMLSEGFHSIADTGNQGLLLWGLSSSRNGPSVAHPFGRGKEVYFWSFMVAVMLFAGGSVLSFNHGYEGIAHPHPIENPTPSFIVLGVAALIEGYVFFVALRHFNKERGSRSLRAAIRTTKDTSTLVVMLEDAAALLGLGIAALGIWLAVLTENPVWDGIASILIGVLLAVVAWVLAVETKALLIGEAASRSDRSSMRLRILAVPEVESVGRLLTMHMGPEEILVNTDIDLVDGIDDAEVEAAIDKVEAAIREVLPSVKDIFVELESRRG